MAQLDVVIPLGPKDDDMIQRCIDSVHMFVTGVRYIYVVTDKSRKVDISGCVIIDEKDFPFKRDDVATFTSASHSGWYLQQLIKLYSPLLIKNILENVLILDADNVFYKKTKFIESGKFLFDKVIEPTHEPYYEHMARLHPSFLPWKKNTSGITHMMIFNKKIILEIIDKVEQYHKGIFWELFLENVTEKKSSGASEYELYFNYVMINKQDLVKIRPLQWNNYGQRAAREVGDWHYVTYHNHQQKKARVFA